MRPSLKELLRIDAITKAIQGKQKRAEIADEISEDKRQSKIQKQLQEDAQRLRKDNQRATRVARQLEKSTQNPPNSAKTNLSSRSTKPQKKPAMFMHYNAYSIPGTTQKRSISTGSVHRRKSPTVKSTKLVRKPSATQIVNEALRVDPRDCLHIKKIEEAEILYGEQSRILDIPNYLEQWRETQRDRMGRKLRSDCHALLAGVISTPTEMEDATREKFFQKSIKYLQGIHGSQLIGVIAHRKDEPHQHLHYFVVPKIGQPFTDIHPGYKASQAVMHKAADRQKNGGEKVGKKDYIEARRSFKEAMSKEQDLFFEEVAVHFGLSRLGPARARLPRPEYNSQKTMRQRAEFERIKTVEALRKRRNLETQIRQAEKRLKELEDGKITAVLGGALGVAGATCTAVSETIEQTVIGAFKAKTTRRCLNVKLRLFRNVQRRQKR